MLNTRKLKADSFAALIAQGLAFGCSVIMTLVVPKILGVESFGYWQLFIFYSSYLSYFQFGLVDGIYLKNGGKYREEIDGAFISAQFRLFLIYQIGVSIVMAVSTFIFVSGNERTYVLLAESVYLVISNSCFFWGYLLQAINETRKFSYSIMLDRILFMVPLLICSIMRINDFRLYVALFILARLISLVYIVYNVREYLHVASLGVKDVLKDSLVEMKNGLVLSTANICSMLILGCARFVIDGKWGIEEFGQLSLSLSIVNFAITFITQVSMVLFPAIRQLNKADATAFFSRLRNAALGLFPLGYLLYFPLRYFVVIWLPQYASAATYLLYLMPICVLEAQTNLVYITYYKVFNKQMELLETNILALLMGAGGSFLGAFLFNDVRMTVVLSLAGIITRYIASDYLVVKDLRVGNNLAFIASILMAVLFIIVGSYKSVVFSLFVCIICLVSYYMVYLYNIKRNDQTVKGI